MASSFNKGLRNHQSCCAHDPRVMDRDHLSFTDDPNSSDQKSGSESDGGTRGGLGGAAGICGFRILDVQNLRDGVDGTDQEPGTENSLVSGISIYDVSTGGVRFTRATTWVGVQLPQSKFSTEDART